jgi:hypothetical protein
MKPRPGPFASVLDTCFDRYVGGGVVFDKRRHASGQIHVVFCMIEWINDSRTEVTKLKDS